MGIKRYNWRRILLAAVLIGACIWCIESVRQVYSNQKNNRPNQIGMAQKTPLLQYLQSG
jgi:hypothetical protein